MVTWYLHICLFCIANVAGSSLQKKNKKHATLFYDYIHPYLFSCTMIWIIKSGTIWTFFSENLHTYLQSEFRVWQIEDLLVSKIYGGQIPIVLLLPYIRANSFSIMASDHDFVPPLKKGDSWEKRGRWLCTKKICSYHYY